MLPKINRSFAEGFFDGLGVGLFTRLRRPGAPDELIDSRSLEEFVGSNDFRETISRFREAHDAYCENQARERGSQTGLATLLVVGDDIQRRVDEVVHKVLDHTHA